MANSRISRLRKLLTVSCGMLCLLFLALWVLSYFRGAGVRREWRIATSRPNPEAPGSDLFDRKDGSWELRSDSGIVLFSWLCDLSTYDGRVIARMVPQPLTIQWSSYHYAPSGALRPYEFAKHNFMGLSHYDPWGQLRLWSSHPAPFFKDIRGTVTTIPYWMLVLLTAIPTLLGGRRWLKNRRLAKRGLCHQCGYDLRAHHPGDRCPECGTPVPQPPAATFAR